jgi:hypothetical protein
VIYLVGRFKNIVMKKKVCKTVIMSQLQIIMGGAMCLGEKHGIQRKIQAENSKACADEHFKNIGYKPYPKGSKKNNVQMVHIGRAQI